MLRTAFGVFAGFVVAVAGVMGVTLGAMAAAGLGADDPPTPFYLVLNLGGSAAAAALGGWLAALLDGPGRWRAAVILAVVLFVLSVPAVFGDPLPGQPGWYPLAIAVIGPAGALLGGRLGVGRAERPPELEPSPPPP